MARKVSRILRLGALLFVPATIVAVAIGWAAYRVGVRDSLDFEGRTNAAHARLTRIFDSISLPHGFVLVSRQSSGSKYPLESERPSQERVFRVIDSTSAPSALINTLRTQGWRLVYEGVSCDSEVRRGEAALIITFRRQLLEPDTSTGPGCPRKGWQTVFVSILLRVE